MAPLYHASWKPHFARTDGIGQPVTVDTYCLPGREHTLFVNCNEADTSSFRLPTPTNGAARVFYRPEALMPYVCFKQVLKELPPVINIFFYDRPNITRLEICIIGYSVFWIELSGFAQFLKRELWPPIGSGAEIIIRRSENAEWDICEEMFLLIPSPNAPAQTMECVSWTVPADRADAFLTRTHEIHMAKKNLKLLHIKPPLAHADSVDVNGDRYKRHEDDLRVHILQVFDKTIEALDLPLYLRKSFKAILDPTKLPRLGVLAIRDASVQDKPLTSVPIGKLPVHMTMCPPDIHAVLTEQKNARKNLHTVFVPSYFYPNLS